MQQENDSKHKSKSITEWQQKNKTKKNRPSGVVRSVSWPHHDWDALVREQFTPEITRISLNSKAFCKEEWCCILPDHCAGLIHNYRKCLVEVIAAKGGSTSHEITHSHSSSTVNVCMVCLAQTWNSIIVWVLGLLLGLFWRVHKMLWPIYVEININ